MKLTFLGTRGYIDIATARHRRHTATLLSYRRKRILLDCGEDWLGKLGRIKPHAILITHAHPDHAFGLKEGTDCPVFATQESWDGMASFPIADRRTVGPRDPFDIGAMRIEAFPVIHSILAPAVGYRVRAGRVTIFYVPDLISIVDRAAALKDVRLYIGDGATLVRPLIRRKGEQLFGHTSIRAQLGWCQEEGVKRAIITHCGTQIVGADTRQVEAKVGQIGRERGIKAEIAHDGMDIILR